MGQLILPTSGSIYIDTSVAIYTIEGNPDYYSILQQLWSKFYTGDIQIINSELILMEVLVVPLRNMLFMLQQLYLLILTNLLLTIKAFVMFLVYLLLSSVNF